MVLQFSITTSLDVLNKLNHNNNDFAICVAFHAILTERKEEYMDEKKPKNEQQVGLNINLDQTPILYTDNIFMNANEDGIVLDIGQKVFNTNQVRIVTRIGMSRTHAKKFLQELSKLLAMTEGHLQSGSLKKN